ncbi:NAD(P)-binding protein [Thozetella sp. PMI_491]|nr:NAD(P)-binding protein [Thozetella sp. PMI_491]
MAEPSRDANEINSNLALTAPPLVPTIHKKPYASLSPLRPELSQAGRTILITGGSAGIGFAIARAYAAASPSTIILTGRRSDVLQQAASRLSDAHPNVKVIPRVCDVANAEESAKLWSNLHDEGIVVHVLVLNAANFGDMQQGLLDIDLNTVWAMYQTNVFSLLDFSQRLNKQKGAEDQKKYIVYVSTAAIHSRPIAAVLPGYSLSKAAGHFLIQKIAEGAHREKLQIVSFHPGQILSETAQNSGLDANSYDFDDENLPGRWAVWAATNEAAYLHGRFAWAAWDVNELENGNVKQRINTDPDFLTLGFIGF